MVRVPRFACSHTVAGTCTIRLASDAHAATSATIPAGTYWTDPVYGSATVASNLLGVVADKFFTTFGETVTPSYYAIVPGSIYVPLFASSPNLVQLAAHSSNTDEGRRLLQRIGVSPYVGSSLSDEVGTLGIPGVWGSAGRAESGSMAETLAGDTGGVSVSADGTAYAVYTGEPQRERLVVLQALPGQMVMRGTRTMLGAASANSDYSLQTHLWDVLKRGERVRYYEDVAATYTYLASACAVSATSISLASNTGANVGDVVVVDGEAMRLVANTSGTTWAVNRTHPVAHAAYEPVGMDGAWVATYVLAAAGGNVNRGEFSPRRRAVNQDRWDVELSLVRATP